VGAYGGAGGRRGNGRLRTAARKWRELRRDGAGRGPRGRKTVFLETSEITGLGRVVGLTPGAGRTLAFSITDEMSEA
jgi:hypothetical protein